MSEASEIFSELLFGSGAWIGFILLLVIICLAAYKNRILCICMIPTSICLSVMYFANVTGDNDLTWAGVIFLVLPMFLAWKAISMKDD